MSVLSWAPGQMLDLKIPASSKALRAGGETFLTDAFHATGALAADNRVSRITQFEECPGGSTGRKLLLSVAYEKPQADLHTELFVKFSRDFDDPLRDRAKIQMESEVRFAALSRMPGFPIAVPKCYYADYHRQSGTGILITERVAYGVGNVERHYEKCLDYEIPDQIGHYRALVGAIAKLAGMHKAGRLSEDVAQQFPFDPDKLAVSERAPYTTEQLQRRVARYAAFAEKYPQLLPQAITSPAFVTELGEQVVRFPEHIAAIKRFLSSRPDFIALCHWNANIDNAWFWRNAQGKLECGLLDWGHVSQMNVAMALWGSLCGAEREIWDELDALLGLFVREFSHCGAPSLDVRELKLHLELYIAMMGLTWLLDAPALIEAQIPDLDQIANCRDSRFKQDELARAQLHLMTTFLNLWQTQDFGAALDRFLARENHR